MKKAKESAFIKRTRKKLIRRLAEIDEKITPKALQEVSNNIHKWIARHEGERIKLKGMVALFDANKHPAQVKSHFVQDMLNNIGQEMENERRALRGRIKHSSGNLED